MNPESIRKVAVVGGGVAGIVAAYLLQERFEVSLYERNAYIGGHTNTVVIEEGPDAGTSVDTGFIVFNERTYPNFIRFLGRLGVGRHASGMSFSYHDTATGLAYASTNADTFLAQRSNILRPSFWMMALAILRFNHLTPRHLEQGRLAGLTLGQFLERNRFNRYFVEQYLIPICASVWSAPDVRMMEFPMETFARFFLNHGLLSVTDQPRWYTVEGGSHSYVKAFLGTFRGKVFPETPVRSVRRTGGRVQVESDRGMEEYDAVVLASHADESLAMLADPSAEEQRLLGAWEYSRNRTLLHTDTSFMPPLAKAWASWNYQRTGSLQEGSPVMLTYWMNRLQGLRTKAQYCVTLNPRRQPATGATIRELLYTHPVYTTASLATQEGISGLSGDRNTCYCGSYLGYGFHEDAVKSAVAAARLFGVEQ
ncbi:MAG TPA: FAD-dependent oxidoreductase [Deltaproteobacteria bacterium]|nr:FAD-dependent oxidoreductase [Deltaproteobacteria bacterium]